MKITDRFKSLLIYAKLDGYTHVYNLLGAYKATTYCEFHSIDQLLLEPIGSSPRRGHQWGERWSGCSNTRQVNPGTDIRYTELFRRYPNPTIWKDLHTKEGIEKAVLEIRLDRAS
jgi:hypothetical protein